MKTTMDSNTAGCWVEMKTHHNERLAPKWSNMMNTLVIKITHNDLKDLVVNLHVVLHLGRTFKERYIN